MVKYLSSFEPRRETRRREHETSLSALSYTQFVKGDILTSTSFFRVPLEPRRDREREGRLAGRAELWWTQGVPAKDRGGAGSGGNKNKHCGCVGRASRCREGEAMGKCFSVLIPNTYKLNCFIMGPAAVGKTMILYTLKLGEANTRNWNPTPAYNFEVNKQTMSHGAKCEMHMWDLSGAPSNRALWPMYYNAVRMPT